jgi:hypothetical protein
MRRMRTLRALVAAFVTAGVSLLALPAPSAGAAEHGDVVVWGDSLAAEARPYLEFFGRAEGLGVVEVRAFGGTAPCDWFHDVRTRLHDGKPRVAVVSFSGNALSPCMRPGGRYLTDTERAAKYWSDLRRLIYPLRAAGVPVLLVGQPPEPDDGSWPLRLERILRRIATEYGPVEFVAAGAAVADAGHWTPTLPCLPFESNAQGCAPDGRIPVRAPDRSHFCPSPDPARPFQCPKWSSGAARFGLAIVQGVKHFPYTRGS